MDTATTIAHACARLAALAATVLGMVVLSTQVSTLLADPVSGELLPALVAWYFLAGVGVMLSLWALAFLAARTGVQAAFVALAALMGPVVPLISLTADWRLYALAGVGALVETENLTARVRRAIRPA
jgi:hypothetical protein